MSNTLEMPAAGQPTVVSDRKRDANRANAKKSTGPRTPAGKAKVARNATKHGLAATTFVTDYEDSAEFEQIREAYIARFAPRDAIELNLVFQMVHSVWNQHRAWGMETEAMNLQMKRMRRSVKRDHPSIATAGRQALAFEYLARRPDVSLLQRYEARLGNQFNRALKTLLEIRKQYPLAQPETAVEEAAGTPVHATQPVAKQSQTRPAVTSIPAAKQSQITPSIPIPITPPDPWNQPQSAETQPPARHPMNRGAICPEL